MVEPTTYREFHTLNDPFHGDHRAINTAFASNDAVTGADLRTQMAEDLESNYALVGMDLGGEVVIYCAQGRKVGQKVGHNRRPFWWRSSRYDGRSG